MRITDYADAGSRTFIEGLRKRAFCAVLPSALSGLGEILSAISSSAAGLTLAQLRMLSLCTQQQLQNVPQTLAAVLPESGHIVAIELVTDDRSGGWAAWSKIATTLQVGLLVYFPLHVCVAHN